MENSVDVLANIKDLAEVGAWIAIAWAFMTGKVFSSVAVDKILSSAIEMTTKLANEISEKIETAVENGVLKAYTQMNGKKTAGD